MSDATYIVQAQFEPVPIWVPIIMADSLGIALSAIRDFRKHAKQEITFRITAHIYEDEGTEL